jgi:hypothetical protein
MADGAQQQHVAPDAAAVRETVAALVPRRTREDVLGSDDAFAKLGLARFRNAALTLKGSRLYAKLQTAAPPVLHDPPGCAPPPPSSSSVESPGSCHPGGPALHARRRAARALP